LTAIESDLRYDFSVVELASLLNLSTGHFSRAFRASTQLSPRQWIIRHRIETAMDMLRQTDQLIADIAITCGFSEQGHFTRKFKQITGLSPTAWRRSNKL
jgi:transcriptional regulator GlxA family with amidase domain